jgi:tetratricopeptide (TPR) repeat protein
MMVILECGGHAAALTAAAWPPHSRMLPFLMLRTLLACLVALPLLADIAPPSEREKWIAIDAGDLQIYSSAGERETTSIATNLLRMREAIGRVTQLKVRSAVPTRVFVFRNDRAMAQYADVANGRHAQISGLFLGATDGNYILLDAGAAGGIDRVVHHELTHFFVKNTLAGLPLWFHEGIAEYYSTFTADDAHADVGMPVKEHVLWLRNEQLIPLAQLFAIDESSDDYNEGKRQGVFYAESWALLHYLLNNPQRREQLPQFLSLLDQKEPVEAAFGTAFHTTFEEMERELKGYLRGFTFQYHRYDVKDLAIPPVPAPVPMTHADVLYRLGDLLARGTGGRGNAEAERFLLAATSENKEHAGAWATLAMLHDTQGRAAEAQVEYDRAVRFGSDDPQVYLWYGQAVLANAVRTEKPSQAEALRARKLFARAAELNRNSARALAGLGETYVVTDEDPAPGIAALERSIALSPGQDDATMSLLQLYARAGRNDDAKRIFDTVIVRGGDAKLVARAREVLLWGELDRAQKLLQADKVDEAAPILRSVMSATTNADLKARIGKLLEQIDAQNAASRQADAINQAIALANTGKVPEAIAAIDAVLPQITDPELRQRTQDLRADMAKTLRKR